MTRATLFVLPVLLVLVPLTADASPLTLRWESIPGAASYEVEIASDEAFTAIVSREKTSATRFRWTPPAEGPFWWRVRALDVDGKPGEFSEPGAVGAPAPKIEPDVTPVATPVKRVKRATPAPSPAPVAAAPTAETTPGGMRVWAGARAGVFHNLAEVASPYPALELSARRSNVVAALVAGRYTASISDPAHGVRVRSSLTALPLLAVAALERPTGGGALHAGGGVSLTWFQGSVKAAGQPAIRTRAVAPGLHVLAGYSRPVARRLELSVDAGWCFGTKTGDALETSPTGLSATVGVRVPLGGGAP